MNNLHIYPTDGMEEYIPRKVYYGTIGSIQAFCDSMSSFLFPKADSIYFNARREQAYMELFNAARKLSLLDMRMSLIIKKMNWYAEKIIELASDSTCDYNGYSIFLECYAKNYSNELGIDVYDCGDNHFSKKYKIDYEQFISEPNYLKRDYSDKLMAYTCNLIELYSKYFNKEKSSYGPGLSIHMNGDRCIGGRGYIEWS
jgi:hypothetical protein